VPTTQLITIDVYLDGVSIFGSSKIQWEPGQTDSTIVIQFAFDPLPVSQNDIFTYEVLSADPLATDGILELELLVK
jgi:hypothetical protein